MTLGSCAGYSFVVEKLAQSYPHLLPCLHTATLSEPPFVPKVRPAMKNHGVKN